MSEHTPELAKHLATVNLWRNPDNSLSVTFAEARGVASELGDSGAPVHLCAMNALKAAVNGPLNTRAQPDTVAQLVEMVEELAVFARIRSNDDSKTFARVNRGALRSIADRCDRALANLAGEGE